MSLEAIYKQNDYGETVLGRTKDDRRQAYFSIAYGDIQKFRVMLFGDVEHVEHVERDSYHRAIGTISNGTGVASGSGATANPNDTPTGYCPTTYGGVAVVDCFDPNSAPTNINYNWDALTHDRNWSVGIGVDWFVVPRIKLSASAVVARTDGNEDITVQPGAAPSPPAVPIDNFDDSKKLALNLKGTFQVGKVWEIIGGYSYERYTFDDISYNGYQYYIPGSTTAPCTATTCGSYLTGIYAFPDYTVHIVYLTTTFRF